MRDAAMLIALLICAYLGFALLALSQPRNWSIAMGERPFRPASVPALRAGGSVMLIASLLIALMRDGPALGAILWVVILAIAGMLVVFTLTWRHDASGR